MLLRRTRFRYDERGTDWIGSTGKVREAAINLRQLRYFIKVVEAGNITRAARALNVAQPSLGVQIRLLEEEFGLPLLKRHSRGITATSAGQLLLQRARCVLHQIDGIGDELRVASGNNRRKIVLGLPPSMIALLGPELLLYVQDEMPGLSISLVEERSVTLIEAMERDEIDLAFAYEIEERHDLWRRPVLEEELVFVTAPDKAPPGGTIELAAALSSNLAIAGGRGLIRKLVEREAERLSMQLTLAFEIHSISALKAILQQGKATGIMPYGLAAEEIASGSLVCCRIERPVMRTLYVERPSWRVPPVDISEVDKLCDWIAERLLGLLGPYARQIQPTSHDGQKRVGAKA